MWELGMISIDFSFEKNQQQDDIKLTEFFGQIWQVLF